MRSRRLPVRILVGIAVSVGVLGAGSGCDEDSDEPNGGPAAVRSATAGESPSSPDAEPRGTERPDPPSGSPDATTPPAAPAPETGTGSEERGRPFELLALGDSYTSAVGVADARRWPEITVERLREEGMDVSDPTYVATGGWTSRQLLDALRERELAGTFDAVAVLIGTNDALSDWSTDRFRDNYRAILERSVELAGGRPERVLAMTIPDYSVTPVGERIGREEARKDVEAYNGTIREVARELGARVVDIEPVSEKIGGNPELLADALHPGPRVHAWWGERAAAAVRELVSGRATER